MRYASTHDDDDGDDDDDDGGDDDGDDENDHNLVDQSHEVSIRPSGLVQVVRLLQHLGQLLAPNIPAQHICTHILGTKNLHA